MWKCTKPHQTVRDLPLNGILTKLPLLQSSDREKDRLSEGYESQWARSIQPKFQPVRPGKEDHLKRWTRFFETFLVGPNRSIEFWTEISGNFG